MAAAKLDLAGWTHPEVLAQVRAAYNAYSADLNRAYAAYYQQHPTEAGAHPRQAADLAKALPPGYGQLVNQFPAHLLHQHHLSGRSSQIIALSLLGAGRTGDASLGWLFGAFGNLPGTDMPRLAQFEVELSPQMLNEQPRPTTIDYYVETSNLAMAIECKFGEDGLGRCSCGKVAQATAGCANRVLERDAYWDVARNLFFLPDRKSGKPCPISLGYQAIRNVAAVRALATDGRRPVFGLIYDARNPYFAGVGDWPGWPTVLDATLQHQDEILFRSASWQQLLASPVFDPIRNWARDKHGLASLSNAG